MSSSGARETRRSIVILLVVLGTVLAAAGLAAVALVANAEGRSRGAHGENPTRALRPQRSPATGFDQVAFGVRPAQLSGGLVATSVVDREGCALLADTPDRQRRGLMRRRDLGGYDAMVFQFAGDTAVGFYNKGVPIPLSIAWFDRGGVFLDEADLPVCSDACPTVSPVQQFRYAVEVPKGGLYHLGIGPGSVLHVGGSCT